MSTDRDYADKAWLRELNRDSFQIISSERAGALILIVLFLALAFERLARELGWAL